MKCLPYERGMGNLEVKCWCGEGAIEWVVIGYSGLWALLTSSHPTSEGNDVVDGGYREEAYLF